MIRRVAFWLLGAVALTVAVAWLYGAAIAPTLYPPTATPVPPTPDTTAPLIPPFTPSFPCELQNAEAHDAATCRSECIEETQVANVGTAVLIVRQEHKGFGCFTGISADTRELRLCDMRSGAIYTTLADHLASDLLASPDGGWFAFTTLDWFKQSDSDGGTPRIGIYRVRRDGSGLTRLDTQGLPPGTVGAQIVRWSDEGAWLEVALWDGAENGWHPYRIKADGSGTVESKN